MTEMEYIKQLEERVENLENIIRKITIEAGNNISFNGGALADIYVSEGCSLSFNNCSIGSVMPGDIDDAEERILELESRLEDIVDQIDDIDNKSFS